MVFTTNETSSAPKPIEIIQKRPLHIWTDRDRHDRLYGNDHRRRSQLNGTLLPNDEAFIDAIIENNLPQSSEYKQFLTLESSRTKITGTDASSTALMENKGMMHTHVIRYKGQPIWTLETKHFHNSSGSWGQSSSCVLSDGILRVNLLHKGRRSSGEGWNTMEKRIFSLDEIIKGSGELRSEQLVNAEQDRPRVECIQQDEDGANHWKGVESSTYYHEKIGRGSRIGQGEWSK